MVHSCAEVSSTDARINGTRPGEFDPGVVGHRAPPVQRLRPQRTIRRNDVRDLLASGSPAAKLALDCFTHRIALFAGMLTAAMGGADGFVFTAGVGENAPAICEAVAKRLE